MKIKAYDIRYDTDADVSLADSLPKEIVFDMDEDADPSEDLADLISDETGFCIYGCQWEKIE